MSDGQTYTLRWRGKQFGPYPLDEINRKLDDHEIGMGHEILWQDEWITIEEFFSRLKSASSGPGRPEVPSKPGVAGVGTLPPVYSRPVAAPSDGQAQSASNTARFSRMPAIPGEAQRDATRVVANAPSATTGPAVLPRKRLLYALLAILFGFAGVHNYYARHWLTGLLQLLLSIATFLLGFGIIAPWLWAVLEAVLVRKDGNGLEMT